MTTKTKNRRISQAQVVQVAGWVARNAHSDEAMTKPEWEMVAAADLGFSVPFATIARIAEVQGVSLPTRRNVPLTPIALGAKIATKTGDLIDAITDLWPDEVPAEIDERISVLIGLLAEWNVRGLDGDDATDEDAVEPSEPHEVPETDGMD